MLGDIAVMVFALIAIFTGKKWAIITATIWFIVAAVIGFAIGIMDPSLLDSGLTSDVAKSTIPLSDDTELTREDIAGIFLILFEIFLIIIGWIRVIFTKKKKIPQA